MGSRVIVLGGGPVGLGAALELARCGVGSVLIEKHEATSWHPKTRNFNTRTMEIARGWGNAVYKRLRSIDTPPGRKSPIRFLESATGREFGKIESLGFEGPGPDVSPALPVMSSQDLIEEILLDAVRASGVVDVRFGTEATRLLAGGAPDDRQAVLEIRDRKTGAVAEIAGPALVAADGADSMIRTALGLELEGAKNLHHVVNCYFRAEIERHIGERRGVLLFVSNPRAAGVLQPLDGAGRWLCQITVAPEQWSLDVFTRDRAREWIRAAAGLDELDVQVLSLGLWKLNATVVERMVQGRIVICGDAAHQFPPTGGLGVNTGLQGMHNAMWKLGLFVKDQAGWPLVETYDTERRGVSQSIVSQSLQNSINVARTNAAAVAGADSGLSAEEVVTASRRYGNHLGVEFGAHYASLAIIPDATTPPDVADSYSDYVQTATPGCRAPHVWLGHADAALSTLDLVGAGFTLLAGSRGTAWREVVRQAERTLGVRIDCYVIGGAGLQDSGRFAEVYGIGAEGGVLLRPDGHVAWRCVAAPSGGEPLLAVLKQILAAEE
ncbi:MAG TPA: FAD-dependent monooxygenase [Candidatus Dormibacteraeota bacterium]|nr:FAD-dependent monooxygenase [Candidatus Dormibacteraeota bacterium]